MYNKMYSHLSNFKSCQDSTSLNRGMRQHLCFDCWMWGTWKETKLKVALKIKCVMNWGWLSQHLAITHHTAACSVVHNPHYAYIIPGILCCHGTIMCTAWKAWPQVGGYCILGVEVFVLHMQSIFSCANIMF